MILIAKGWYSVIALVHMAMQKPQSVIDLQDIADSQKISFSYLHQLFIKMDEAGLVVKKAKSKYTLAKKPDDIFVADVMFAVGESIPQYNALVKEGHKKNSEAREMTEQFQNYLDKQMNVMVEGVSLTSIINGGYGAEQQRDIALKLVSNL